jgi:hypothetical protein
MQEWITATKDIVAVAAIECIASTPADLAKGLE